MVRRWYYLLHCWRGSTQLHNGNATVEDMLKELGNTLQLVQENLVKAQEYQKKYADQNRRHEEFEIGDQVLLDAE